MYTRKILNWCEEKYEDSIDDYSFTGYAKAFGLGAIEGAIDGMVIIGALLTLGSIATTICNKSKK